MGIIEDRLAELKAKEQVRVDHDWRPNNARLGGFTCTKCGGFISGHKNPNLRLGGCPGGPESWRELRVGDRVKVVTAPSEVEREVLGREFTISHFTKPRGYACCEAGDEVVLLHPEALEVFK